MKSVFTTAALGATVSAFNHMDLEYLLSRDETTLLDQIDHALEAADIMQKEVEATTAMTTEEHRTFHQDCKKVGYGQCENLCNAYPGEQVVDCKANCYAKCFPKNSKINETETAEKYEPSCGAVSYSVYKDEYCYEPEAVASGVQ